MTAKRFVMLTFVVNLIVAILIAFICLLVGGRSLSVAAGIGGVTGALNVAVIGLIAIRMFSSGGGRIRTVLLLILKSAILVGLALAAVAFLAVSGIGLAAGISASVISVLATSLYVAAKGGGIEF